MMIPAAELDAYTQQLEAQQRAAQTYAETALNAFKQLNPDVSEDELKEYAQTVMESAYRQFGDQAGTVAANRYDETVAKLGIEAQPAEVHNDIPADLLEWGTDKTYADFAKRMGGNAYDHARRTANKTVQRNAVRDYKKGVRYARVPTGKETCGFCLMLAARGFAYSSAAAAGEEIGLYNSFHRFCDCRVVAGDASTRIEGYDPDALYSRYLDARAAVDVNGIRDAAYAAGADSELANKLATNAIVNELNRRNASWLWDGESGTVTIAEGAGESARSVAESVASHGFDVTLTKTGASISGQVWDISDISLTEPVDMPETARRHILNLGAARESSESWQADLKNLGESIEAAMADAPGTIECLVVDDSGLLRRYKAD